MNYRITFLLSFIIFFFTQSLISQGGYAIDHSDIKVIVSQDGTFTVTESLDITFSEERHGIFRKVPYKYEVDGRRKSIKISDINVTVHNYKVSNENGEKVIRIGDANKYVIGNQNYKINYKVSGAITTYEDHDEFYWNLISFNSDAPNNRSSFSITFPTMWADSVTDYRAFSGSRGSVGTDIVLHQDGNTIVGAHRSVLPPNHGITLAVKMPKGLIIRSGHAVAGTEDAVRSPMNWVFTWWNLIPIGLGSLLLGLWRKFERSSSQGEVIEDQFYPPDGMSPAEVGTFYDHKVNRRDIISLLPYWGNQGLLSIKSVDGSEGDMYFTKLTDAPKGLPNYQEKLFEDLFKERDLVLLSDLKEQFYTTMSKTSSLLKKEVKEQELYDTRSREIFHSGWLIALALLSIAIGIFVIIYSGAVVGGIGLFIIAITSFILHFKTPKLSEKGIEYQRHLKGLYQFLKNPKSEKMSSLVTEDVDYLHHIYPYVLAFGLDKSWTSFQKEGMSYAPPIWYDGSSYHGNNTFNYNHFSNSFSVRKIEQVFYSAPPPPSSPGSGGGFSGGSAGGGFGGGSTGSW